MKIAVVGSGVSGLAATWGLNEYSDHEVHLFEAADRPGGHTNTVDFARPGAKGGETTRVDTGFIVCNNLTYPNFLRFLDLLKIPIVNSDMSFAVTRDRGAFEWAGGSPGQLFAQRSNLFNPGHWRMVWDIIRFNSDSLKLLRQGDKGESIGDYLKRNGYSDSFRDNYLLPMTAAIWSTPPDKAALDFPAFTLLRFMHNHALLQLTDRPQWLTVKGGSHTYVKAVLDSLPQGRFHLSTPVERVDTAKGHVTLTTASGEKLQFDHVVFATHADTALRILNKGSGVTKAEKDVLGGFEFSKNRAVLHGDPALMPQRRETWSAWNYLTQSDGPKANVGTVSLTYWMNLLQSIPEGKFGPVLVTLNPPFEPKKDLVVGEWEYEHPLFTEQSVKCQALLPTIQHKRGLSFCGAWSAYGFHEDGFSSGLRAAVALGAAAPFTPRHAERALPYPLKDRLLDIFIFFAELYRRLLERPFDWLLAFLLVGTRIVVFELKTMAAFGAVTGGSRSPVKGVGAELEGWSNGWVVRAEVIAREWRRARRQGARKQKRD